VRNTRNPPRAFTLFMMYYVENYGLANSWPGKKGFGILDPLPPYPAIIGRRSLGEEGGDEAGGEAGSEVRSTIVAEAGSGIT
jgi:hypothetical protein